MVTSASKVYARLSTHRDSYESRAREISELTIPYMFVGNTDEIQQEHSLGEMVDPHQSVGARGVRNLASRLLLTQLPSNAPFFNYIVDDSILNDLPEGLTKGDVEKRLSDITRIIHQWMQKSDLRKEATEIFMSLLIDGNPLMFVDEDMNIQTFRLDHFVCERDQSGNILQIVVKETLNLSTLDSKTRKFVEENTTVTGEKKKNIDVYTWVKRQEDGSFTSHQEVNESMIPDSKSEYPKGSLPWVAPRIAKITGENYGRPYAEEFIGDLRACENLSASLLDMAAASSRVLFLMNPSSVTDVDDLNGAPNGSVVPGRLGDIEALQAKLGGDFTVVQAQNAAVEQRLAQGFLLLSSIQRDAERVTAEEVRMMAQELDNALGGMFSTLSFEFQMPLVKAFEFRLKQKIGLELPPELEISVITGLDALGRGQDLNRLRGFVSQVLELQNAGVETAQFLDVGELIKRLGAGNGIDTNDLVKTPEQISQEQEQAQMQQAMQNQGANAIQKGIENQTDPAKQAALLKAQQETQQPQEG
jgi:hypothetical protein